MESTMTLVGRLGKDPIHRTTKAGKEVCNFSLAVAGSKGVTWYNIAAWNKLALVCANYLTKGRLVQIEGFMTSQEWVDREGNEKVSEKLFANWVKFLDSPKKVETEPEAVAVPEGGCGESTCGETCNDCIDDDIPF